MSGPLVADPMATARPPRSTVDPADSAGPGRRTWAVGGRSGSERGSALVEFTFLGVVVLVPLVYLILTVARLQAATFAVTVAAREGARAFVTTQPGDLPEARSRAAAELAFSDQGFGDSGTLEVTCSASPCLAPEAEVRVRAVVTVTLPGAPGMIEDARPWPRIPVDFTHVAVVDRFRPR